MSVGEVYLPGQQIRVPGRLQGLDTRIDWKGARWTAALARSEMHTGTGSLGTIGVDAARAPLRPKFSLQTYRGPFGSVGEERWTQGSMDLHLRPARALSLDLNMVGGSVQRDTARDRGVNLGLRYRLTLPRFGMSGRVQRVHYTANQGDLPSTVWSSALNYQLPGPFRLNASGYLREPLDASARGRTVPRRTANFSSGLAARLGALDMNASLAANLVPDREVPGALDWERRGSGWVTIPVGSLRSRLLISRTESGQQSLRGSLRWTPPTGGWLELNGTHNAGTAGAYRDFAILSYADLGVFNVDANVRVSDRNGWAPSGTLSLRYRITDMTSVIVSGQHTPARVDEPWEFGLAVTHSLHMPTPVRRNHDRPGVLYLDRNANGRPDAGEAGIPGAVLVLGNFDVVTDGDGRFRIPTVHDPAEIRAAAGTLPDGHRIDSRHIDATGGVVRVPVHETASLRVTFYEDTDRSGSRDPAEPLAEGVTASLDGPSGGGVRVSGPNGEIRHVGLVPGAYTLTHRRHIWAEEWHEAAVTLDFEPGSDHALDIPVPAATRPIRFRSDEEPKTRKTEPATGTRSRREAPNPVAGTEVRPRTRPRAVPPAEGRLEPATEASRPVQDRAAAARETTEAPEDALAWILCDLRPTALAPIGSPAVGAGLTRPGARFAFYQRPACMPSSPPQAGLDASGLILWLIALALVLAAYSLPAGRRGPRDSDTQRPGPRRT